MVILVTLIITTIWSLAATAVDAKKNKAEVQD
jgi:hypothetical protein